MHTLEHTNVLNHSRCNNQINDCVASHLSLISPAFKTVLRKRNGYEEEGRMKEEGHVDILLPNHDLNAFEIILAIMHLPHQLVPKSIDLNMFVDVAILVDKYQNSLESSTAYTSVWLAHLRPVNHPVALAHEVELETWVRIAWVFHSEQDISNLTRVPGRPSPKGREETATCFASMI
jgi:hypothetical protein